MAGKNRWKKNAAILFAGGYLILNTAAVLAAPVELSLDDSVAMALKNNSSIKVAEADREKADWAVSEAKAGKQPTVTFSHTDSHYKSDPSSSGVSVIRDKFDNKLSLGVPLYTGGKLEGTIEQAKLSLKSADLAIEKSKQQVKLDATTGYFSILQARNLVKVNEQSVESLAAHLKNVQAQYAVGTVAKSDVLRSEVELANAQQNLIKAQNSYDLAISSFNNVIGLPLDTELSIKDDLKYEKYTLSLEDSITYGLANRPEAAQAQANIDVAKQGIKVAKSGSLPTVAFSGTTDWNDTDFPGADNNNWSLSLAASWNVFDSGLTKSKVKQAVAGLDKAQEQAKQQQDAIQLEVRQAYLNMKEAEKRIDTSKVAVDKGEEDFKIAQVRYSAGVGTNIDVLDAQVALLQAKTNYIQALYDYNTSKAKLDKAMGVAIQ